ncbi:restriction endonuclease subunit S [Olsenella sp. Marseille-QA0557]|uniref:restriction endonuclease subunit S n=1 Tax=Olsenella sp. Marseille-QA0557 TaxID=3378782 RepID=UPI003D149414
MHNPEEKILTPRIRFSGFTDAWEQRRLGDFVVAAGVRNKDNLPLESFSVSNDRGFVPQEEQFENGGTMREADKTAYWIVEPGSFAYNPARINVGSIGYLSTSDNVIVSSLYEVFRTDESCDDRFLWHWLKSPLFAKQIEMLQEGGVRLYFFFDKLLKSEIAMSSVSEQAALGSLFDRLDNLIALHQRKCDGLKTVKKSLLEKMFPREGETTPELRFSGFTDAWEQRRLGDIAEIVGGGTPNTGNPDFWDGEIDWYSPAELGEHVYADGSVRRITEKGYTSCSAKMLPANKTILFTSRAGIGNTAILRRSACTNQGFQSLVVKDGSDVYFLYTMSGKLKRCAEERASGSTFLEVSGKQLATIEVSLPQFPEQQVIGVLFSQLDNLIALHQRKLDLLKNVKKSLLEGMFV